MRRSIVGRLVSHHCGAVAEDELSAWRGRAEEAAAAGAELREQLARSEQQAQRYGITQSWWLLSVVACLCFVFSAAAPAALSSPPLPGALSLETSLAETNARLHETTATVSACSAVVFSCPSHPALGAAAAVGNTVCAGTHRSQRVRAARRAGSVRADG